MMYTLYLTIDNSNSHIAGCSTDRVQLSVVIPDENRFICYLEAGPRRKVKHTKIIFQ